MSDKIRRIVSRWMEDSPQPIDKKTQLIPTLELAENTPTELVDRILEATESTPGYELTPETIDEMMAIALED